MTSHIVHFHFFVGGNNMPKGGSREKNLPPSSEAQLEIRLDECWRLHCKLQHGHHHVMIPKAWLAKNLRELRSPEKGAELEAALRGVGLVLRDKHAFIEQLRCRTGCFKSYKNAARRYERHWHPYLSTRFDEAVVAAAHSPTTCIEVSQSARTATVHSLEPLQAAQLQLTALQSSTAQSDVPHTTSTTPAVKKRLGRPPGSLNHKPPTSASTARRDRRMVEAMVARASRDASRDYAKLGWVYTGQDIFLKDRAGNHVVAHDSDGVITLTRAPTDASTAHPDASDRKTVELDHAARILIRSPSGVKSTYATFAETYSLVAGGTKPPTLAEITARGQELFPVDDISAVDDIGTHAAHQSLESRLRSEVQYLIKTGITFPSEELHVLLAGGCVVYAQLTYLCVCAETISQYW